MDDDIRRAFDETPVDPQDILNAGFVEANEDGTIAEDDFEGDDWGDDEI